MSEREESRGQQRVPVKLYRTSDRIITAAPMPGLQAEDLTVEVTADNRLVLHGRIREGIAGALFEVHATDVHEGHPPQRPRDPTASREHWYEQRETLLDEWAAGGYHRELDLPSAVNGELVTATYGNGVLVVVLPVADQTRPARISLETEGLSRGQRVGSAGHPVQPLTTAEHQAAMDARRSGTEAG
jgi:HSP20 family protein